MTVRIQTNSTENIMATMTLLKVLQTGLVNVLLKIHRTSDGFIYDFNDSTFKSAGWVANTIAMTEVNSINLPGQYKYIFNTSSIANPAANDNYIFSVACTSADNVPQMGEIKVGQYIDNLDGIISSRATESNAIINTNSIIAEVNANEIKINALQLGVTEILGLVGSNMRITPVNDSNGNMISGVMKLYSSKADALLDINEIHTYTLSPTVDINGFTTLYLGLKD